MGEKNEERGGKREDGKDKRWHVWCVCVCVLETEKSRKVCRENDDNGHG